MTKKERLAEFRLKRFGRLPQPAPDQWIEVSRLAVVTGEPVSKIYAALYDGMKCSRAGRAIRVRVADWNAYWEARATTVIVREPPRARPRTHPLDDARLGSGA